MKRFILIIYIAILILLGAATFIEHSKGSAFVADYIYHAPWFCGVWLILSFLLLWTLFKKRLWHRVSIFLLHLSLLVILGGGALTYITSTKGVLHLTQGVPTKSFQSEDLSKTYPLPFNVLLNRFEIEHYAGTEAPSDYLSHLTIVEDNGNKQNILVSMNHIADVHGYRFYQSSFDENGQGSWLSVNYDPWGTGLTYAGYVLLLLAMFMTLFSRREEFQRLLKNPLLQKGVFLILLFFMAVNTLSARHSLPAFSREKADSLAMKQVVYNDRVAPFNTLARDFVLKIYGEDTYGGLSPEQVVSGWLLRPDAWQNEPMILIKNKELREVLGIEGKYARLTDLFQGDEYILNRYWNGGDNMVVKPNDAFQKAIAETDEKVGLIMMLQNGTLIKPLPKDGSVEPLDDLHIKAEIFYNRIPFTKVLFMFCLTIGFFSFGLFIYQNLRQKRYDVINKTILPWALYVATIVLAFSFSLRWYVSGHVPMSNGFETMQFMALCILLLSCLSHRRFAVMLPFGFILSGFTLLVSSLGQSNPQITNLMPVLASPWLSLHVSVVMVGYALLSFTMLTGVLGLILSSKSKELMLLGRLLLYPAVFFLGIGIFLGAVWANQSWGAYWSWDPKETWALITFMVYAIGFHCQSLSWLRTAKHFHLFCIFAFLTVLMTYFGVNFVLSGMHSYAG